jgi:hypothetical protein
MITDRDFVDEDGVDEEGLVEFVWECSDLNFENSAALVQFMIADAWVWTLGDLERAGKVLGLPPVYIDYHLIYQ